MNNLMNTLRSHKRNNVSFITLALLVVGFLAIMIIDILTNLRTDKLVLLIFAIVIPILIGLIALWYEKRGQSLVAHVLFFVFFLEGFFKEFVDVIFGGVQPLNIVYTVLGAAAGIYIILKVIAHFNEVRASVPIITRAVGVLIVISLINVYIDQNFTAVLTYGLIILLAVATGNGKSALPVVILIYANRVQTTLYSAYRSVGLNSNQKINIVINVLFAAFFIYMAVKLLREDEYNNRYIS